MTLAGTALFIFALYVFAYVAYQAALFIANALIADPKPFQPVRFRRLNVVVPAHNEELYVPRLLAALSTQNYPAERFGVTIIADNCSDGTARVSEGFGARILDRRDEANRGKGYAIGWCLQQ